jgi:hypothetical protein
MYTSDLLERLDEGELKAIQKEAESRGWNVISWGVDSYDALEYTVHRRESDKDQFLSLFLLANPDYSTDFALEYLIESNEGSRKTQLAAGSSKGFSSDDFASLFLRGLTVNTIKKSAVSPLLAAVGAADLALARVNEIVSMLRNDDLKDVVGLGQVRKFSELYRLAALDAFNDLTRRGEAAFGAALLAIEKLAPALDLEAPAEPSRSAAPKESGRFKAPTAPARKAPARKAPAAKKAPARKVTAAKEKLPPQKVPAAAKHSQPTSPRR